MNKHTENKELNTRKDLMYANCKRWRKLNVKALLLSRAKSSAKRKGIEFSITIDDIDIPEICQLLNKPLINKYLNPEGDVDYVPSLDRKDNTKGYTPDNIWIISYKANRMKNTATLEELHTFANNVRDIIKFD